MKKNRWFLRLVGLLAVCGVLTVTAAMAVGTADDPLVTLSYLNDVFLGQIMDKVDSEIEGRNQEIVKALGGQVTGESSGTTATFTVVTLSKGQVLTGDIGCEVMLRVGSATCVAVSSPGLINETSGQTLNNGSALTQNHLYMMTIEGRGVKATADNVKILVRGTYTIA